jgi:hypothetical protein
MLGARLFRNAQQNNAGNRPDGGGTQHVPAPDGYLFGSPQPAKPTGYPCQNDGTGEMNEGGELTTKGRVIQLWKKYKRVTAIAASVGGAIALAISALTLYFTPSNNDQIIQLNRSIAVIKGTVES